MKYIKYEDLLNHKEIRIIKVELKPNAKMTEEEWFRFMVSGNILQVADTIEELCDEFVSYSGFKPYLQNGVIGARRTLTFSQEKGHNIIIWGAIWTDKGLIYVAKMNDKGELELL